MGEPSSFVVPTMSSLALGEVGEAGVLQPAVTNFTPLSNDSLHVETLYTPVIAYYKTNPGYSVLAIRVSPRDIWVLRVPFFRCRNTKLGRYGTKDRNCSFWTVVAVEGGWSQAEMKFRPMIQYPIDLLKALLTVFRTQSFSNGSRLSWNSWLEACRRPIRAHSGYE